MKNIWRFRKEIAIVLTSILILLFIIFLFDSNVITKKILIENKDLIDSLSKIIGAIILMVGAVFSYFKFFKGRIFTEKLLIDLKSQNIANENNNLHVIDVEFKNIGDTAIWYPKENVEIIYISKDGSENISHHSPNSPDEKLDEKTNEYLIEPQETSYRHFTKFVPSSILALTVKVDIVSKKGNKWSKSITIDNRTTATNTRS